jgi:hypothetical protein
MPKLPWGLLVNQLPIVMRAVDTLIVATARRSAARDTAPVLESLHQRVAALEEQQRVSADLLKQVAEHVNAIAVAAEESSRLLRRAMMLAIVAGGVALLALVLGVVAWIRG